MNLTINQLVCQQTFQKFSKIACTGKFLAILKYFLLKFQCGYNSQDFSLTTVKAFKKAIDKGKEYDAFLPTFPKHLIVLHTTMQFQNSMRVILLGTFILNILFNWTQKNVKMNDQFNSCMDVLLVYRKGLFYDYSCLTGFYVIFFFSKIIQTLLVTLTITHHIFFTTSIGGNHKIRRIIQNFF